MIQIKVTWPVLFLLAFGFFVWLIRAPEQPRRSRRKANRPKPCPSYRNNGTGKQSFVIEVPDPHPFDAAGGTDSSDYDAETARLDREAADAARAIHVHHSAQQPLYHAQRSLAKMTAQLTTPPIDDDATALAALEQAAHAVTDPTVAADVIADGLNFLYDNGAEQQGVVLDDIQAQASALVTNVQQLDTHLKSAVSLAAKLRKQREQARTKLAALKTAIEDRDKSNPQIEMLIEELEEAIVEETQFYVWEAMWEHVAERIFDETPFTYDKAFRLLAILTEGELAHDSPLWNEIGEWVNFVDRELGHEE